MFFLNCPQVCSFAFAAARNTKTLFPALKNICFWRQTAIDGDVLMHPHGYEIDILCILRSTMRHKLSSDSNSLSSFHIKVSLMFKLDWFNHKNQVCETETFLLRQIKVKLALVFQLISMFFVSLYLSRKISHR